MCTAISFKTTEHYFGRTLDYEKSFVESVTITPRNFSFRFQKERNFGRHYAMIGMAHVNHNYPLYYDGTNEKGLSIAGLNFPGNAVYLGEKSDMYNVAPYEFIPWVLGQCKDVKDVRELLNKTNLIKLAFSDALPLTPLHFLISDKNESIVVEPTRQGLYIINNPVKVLTNNPPFEYQMYHLNQYMNLTKKEPMNHFAKEIPMENYSRGMGSMGLPGDLSSTGRFVRAAFVKWNSYKCIGEDESVNQFFHILDDVKQTKGCVQLNNGAYEYSIYSSCCNTEKGIYYYKTYENSQISAVDMYKADLEASRLFEFPLRKEWSVYWQN